MSKRIANKGAFNIGSAELDLADVRRLLAFSTDYSFLHRGNCLLNISNIRHRAVVQKMLEDKIAALCFQLELQQKEIATVLTNSVQVHFPVVTRIAAVREVVLMSTN